MATSTQFNTFAQSIPFYQNVQVSFFPLPYGGKGATLPWKEYQTRLPNPQEIEEWSQQPQSNIAVVCGKISGNLVILDCDSEEKYQELSATILNIIGSRPEELTLVSKTGRGYHIWVRLEEPLNSYKFPMLDIKGEGGYIVGPPSRHPDGADYTFLNPDKEIIIVRSLFDLGIDVNQKSSQTIDTRQKGWVGDVSGGVSEGDRNEKAASLAGFLQNLLPRSDVEQLVLGWNMRNNPPLPEEEILKVIASVARYPKHPPEFLGSPNGYRNKHGYKEKEQYIEDMSLHAQNGTYRDKPDIEGGTQRDTAGQNGTKRSNGIITDILEYVIEAEGRYVSAKQIDDDLNYSTPTQKDSRKKAIQRLIQQGRVEKHPEDNTKYRYINREAEVIDIFNSGKDKIIPVKWPLGIDDLVDLYPGNTTVVAGAPNSGKTALLLNFARENMYSHKIFYFSSEMGAPELQRRIERFGLPLEAWKRIEFRERSSNFADVIQPDAVNIVDYLEMNDKMYLIGSYLTEIQRKLRGGIAIVALQKKRDALLGRGAEFSLEKPRLYLTMDEGRIRIEKGKNPHNEYKNPNGLQAEFQIERGCQFNLTSDWKHVPLNIPQGEVNVSRSS